MKQPQPQTQYNRRSTDNEATTPDPDPTYMTRAAIERERQFMTEVVNLRVHEREEVTNTHFEAIGQRFESVIQSITVQGRECAVADQALKDLLSERLRSFDALLAQRDITFEQAMDSAAALVKVQYEGNSGAVDKAQASAEKQLDALRGQMTAEKKAADDKVDDLRNRITSIESSTRGSRDSTTSHQTTTMNTATIIGIVVAAALGLASFIISLMQTMRGVH